MQDVLVWIEQNPVVFGVAVGLVVLFIGLLFHRRWKERAGQSGDHVGEFPFMTGQPNYGGGPNPMQGMQGLQDRLNQLEDILRQVYKKLNDRHRELEQTVTSMEAAMASLEKPFKAVAERCAYGSRLLNSQQNSGSPPPQQSNPAPAPPPTPPGYMGGNVGGGNMGSNMGANMGNMGGGPPPVGYDSPQGYAAAGGGRPQFERISEQSGSQDESYGFRNYPK